MKDEYGLYVQADGDTGDSAHRTGLMVALGHLTDEEWCQHTIGCDILIHLEIDPGIYIRHPSKNNWSSMPDNFSRDQASRIILGFAVMGYKHSIRRWLKAMARRGFFHQNTRDPVKLKNKIPDIMAPGEWRNVIRGLRLWYLRPLLYVLDALFFVDIWSRKPWDGASLFLPDLLYATRVYPTFWAKLAVKMDKRFPWIDKAIAEAKNNHALENNGCVELVPLFDKLALEFRKV